MTKPGVDAKSTPARPETSPKQGPLWLRPGPSSILNSKSFIITRIASFRMHLLGGQACVCKSRLKGSTITEKHAKTIPPA